MATTRGKGGGTDGDTPAETATRRTRTRAPEDEISGVAAPEAPAPAAPAKAPRKRGGSKRETYAETAARRRK
ncbi:MAG TPA: hypothetical protein VE871_16160, partial [Longimicrobium sp.]|nr:hypothetical protein [Longimicrobium sp.]